MLLRFSPFPAQDLPGGSSGGEYGNDISVRKRGGRIPFREAEYQIVRGRAGNSKLNDPVPDTYFTGDIKRCLCFIGVKKVNNSPCNHEITFLPFNDAGFHFRADQEVANDREMDDELRVEIDGIIKAANADLSMHQRIADWRLWPERDFPRTHTLKIKRNQVREWAGGDVALQVRETEEDET